MGAPVGTADSKDDDREGDGEGTALGTDDVSSVGMLVGTKDGDRDSEDTALGADDGSSLEIMEGYVDGVGELTGDDNGVLAGAVLDEPSLFMEGVFEGLLVLDITGALIGFEDLGNTSMEVGAIVGATATDDLGLDVGLKVADVRIRLG